MTIEFDYTGKFEKMANVGRHVIACFDDLETFIRPGVTTNEIAVRVQEYCDKHDVQNSQYGYRGFPAYCCTSLNEQLCHGLPTSRSLEGGDVLKVDITFNKSGYHADSCRTYGVGILTESDVQLIDLARRATEAGVAEALPGRPINRIGRAIATLVEAEGYHLATAFCGHGIGQEIHEAPVIAHSPVPTNPMYFSPDENKLIEPGMAFCIEPIVLTGRDAWTRSRDQWTILARDGQKAAQFETCLGITEFGHVIFAH